MWHNYLIIFHNFTFLMCEVRGARGLDFIRIKETIKIQKLEASIYYSFFTLILFAYLC